MDHPYLVIAAITGLAALYVAFPVIVNTFMTYRKSRRVICPLDSKPATISINARAAALASVVGKVNVRVCVCSSWPERAGCTQGCVMKYLRRETRATVGA